MTLAATETDSERTIRLVQGDVLSTSSLPLYQRLADALLRAIDDGDLPAGSRLGNEIDLAIGLHVSRPTVRQAISILVTRGLVVRRRGLGSVVTRLSIERNLSLSSLYDDVIDSGRSLHTTVLDLRERPADKDQAVALGVAPRTRVIFIRRVRDVDGAPFAIMENVLPAPIRGLTLESLRSGSLYAVMNRAGCRPAVASQQVSARLATPDECELLEVPRPAAVLTARRVSFDAKNRAVEVANHVFLASHYSFDLTLIRNGV